MFTEFQLLILLDFSSFLDLHPFGHGLPSFTGFDSISLNFFYSFIPSSSLFHIVSVKPGFSLVFYKISSSFAGFYWVLLDSTGFY